MNSQIAKPTVLESSDASLVKDFVAKLEEANPAQHHSPTIDPQHVAIGPVGNPVEEEHAGPTRGEALRCQSTMLTAKPARQSTCLVEEVTAQERPPPHLMSINESTTQYNHTTPEAQERLFTTSFVDTLDLDRLHLSAHKQSQTGVQYTRQHHKERYYPACRISEDFPSMQAAFDPLQEPSDQQPEPLNVLVLLRNKLKAVVGMTPAFQRGDGQYGNRDWLRRWAMHQCNIANLLHVIDLHEQYDEAYELAYHFEQLEKQQRLVQMRSISRRLEAQLGHLIDVSSIVMEEGEYELPWPSGVTYSDR